MGTGLDSYDNGTKNTWRGWQWNQIVAHLPEFHARTVPSKGSAAERRVTSTKTVLYLAGPEDLDRAYAIAHGFMAENLIAIDREQTAIDSIRLSGGIGICGSLEATLAAWPANWKIDVLIADFCCGLTKSSIFVALEVIQNPSLANAVVAFNGMRGRDAISNDFRAWCVARGIPAEHVKHRGQLFFCFVAFALSSWIHGLNQRPTAEACHATVTQLWDLGKPVASKYYSKGSGQWFDSVVFGFPFGFVDPITNRQVDQQRVNTDGLFEPTKLAVRRKRREIAAARAVRTRKLARSD